jgi:hypothetical protein
MVNPLPLMMVYRLVKALALTLTHLLFWVLLLIQYRESFNGIFKHELAAET